MSASQDPRDYPNIDARVFWLAQVSETATALAGTQVPDQFNASTETSKVSFEPVVEAKFSSLSARRDDSFDPNVSLVSSHVRSNLRRIKVGGVLMILTLTAGLVAGQPTVTDIWQQLVTDSIRLVQAWSSSPFGAISIGSAKPRLIVQQSRAVRGEPAPLGLMLHGPVDGSIVRIEGLVRGMELSAGRAVGFDGWEVPADDLGNAWIAPPDGFAGSVNLVAELRGPDGEVADRQTITLEWALPNAPVPVVESTTLASISPKPVQFRDDENYRTDTALLESHISPQSAVGGEEAPFAPIQLQSDREKAEPPEVPIPREARWKEIGAASSTLLDPIQLRPDRTEMMPAELSEPPSQRQPNSEELAVLLKRGKDLIATGDLAAARVVLRRAAEANNAEAALALGATYDPLVLRQLKVYGFTPDAAMAGSWYEKAAELGSSAAPRRLEMLTERIGIISTTPAQRELNREETAQVQLDRQEINEVRATSSAVAQPSLDHEHMIEVPAAPPDEPTVTESAQQVAPEEVTKDNFGIVRRSAKDRRGGLPSARARVGDNPHALKGFWDWSR
jgi:hypothetical protein